MKHQADGKQLRSFGLLVGGIFGVIGLWPMILRGGDPRIWALAIGVILAVPALLVPRSLGPAYRGWMALADALAWVNSRLILGLIFYGLVTPMGLVMRALGHDPMRRRFDPGVDSYRVARSSRPGSHMMRQF